jgi:hypothetical protein
MMNIHAVVTSSFNSRISGDNSSAEGMIFTRVTWRVERYYPLG